MTDWEDDLVNHLATGETQAIRDEDIRPLEDLITSAFKAVRNALADTIQRIAERADAVVDCIEDVPSGRIRWTYGERVLALRIERSTDRLFLSIDLGTNLLLDHITVNDHELSDNKGRSVTKDELAERFVPLLFGAQIKS